MKGLIYLLVILVVIIGGYLLLSGDQATDVDVEAVDHDDSALAENLVIYADDGFSPSMLEVKNGATVTFHNDSSNSVWPASAFHPTHGEYPTKGGCLGSTFDACRGVLPGESWSFTFDTVGDWKYHDHLNASKFGSIIVR
jgi:plastocyanin